MSGALVASARALGQSMLDTSLSAVGLAVLSPVLAIASAVILVDDGGPVLFRQERVGQSRAPFKLMKLRTMRDGRVTRAGKWLRATGLDEVPQFLNVVRGEMSVVGPRPLTERDVARLGWDGADHDVRFLAKPGLTGPVQVMGAISAADSMELEREYLARRSTGLDLAIVGATAAILVFGKDRVHTRMRLAVSAIRRRGRSARGAEAS